jgi:hypothetical protein
MAGLTSGLSKVCESRTGGLVRAWFANKHDVTSFTLTGAAYSAVTMASGKTFFKYEFEQDTGQYKEDGSVNESGAFSVNHAIEIYFGKLTEALRAARQQLADATPCGVIGIIEDANNNKWVVGYSEKFGSERALRLRTDASDSGKAFTDANGTTWTIGSIDSEYSRLFTGTVPV